MKRVLLFVGVILVFVLGGSFLLNFFAQKMYAEINCEDFSVEHLELRAHIDVPKIEESATICDYDQVTHKKFLSFQIDTTQVNLTKYIQQNKMRPINVNAPQLEAFKTKYKLTDVDEFYGKLNEKTFAYINLLNKDTGHLYIFIDYSLDL